MRRRMIKTDENLPIPAVDIFEEIEFVESIEDKDDIENKKKELNYEAVGLSNWIFLIIILIIFLLSLV
ncbi:hypothetical protein SAMN05660462_01689 [Proteiniborus ethanoligenes]|uniref:Uncharacterized protein n=1 Tax=Proteiniborus ethanoligenes TaxID=415015 RepID=A0A1H3PYS1_9FIRM|nr:hypothetical protein [Proteiniborus ethanoligenes]TAH63955.1 MAG: hypothetical protein EWM50_00770 [Gottschalkiaceae bacterium]SDZ05945.1 hypothetical protein SAMN05660462_01689 [Proteiniborus ethanoligenes]